MCLFYHNPKLLTRTEKLSWASPRPQQIEGSPGIRFDKHFVRSGICLLLSTVKYIANKKWWAFQASLWLSLCCTLIDFSSRVSRAIAALALTRLSRRVLEQRQGVPAGAAETTAGLVLKSTCAIKHP